MLARKDRREVQAPPHLALDVGVEITPLTLGQVEQVQRRDVHRRVGRLQMQGRTIPAAEGFMSLIHAAGDQVAESEHTCHCWCDDDHADAGCFGRCGS